MMTAVRQTATVSPAGQLQLDVPELPPGTVAEVIVLVQAPATQSNPDPTVADRLAAWHRLQRSSTLTAEAAAAWIRDIRAERDAWPERGEPLRT